MGPMEIRLSSSSKKVQILEVLGYGFVSLVFIAVFMWIFQFFMSPALLKTKENFSGKCGQEPSKDTELTLNGSTSLQRPYVTTEMYMGDFEGDFDRTMIGKYEGGMQATKDAYNLALRQYPFDWTNAPPSSKIFQEQNAIFLEKQNLIRNAETIPQPMMSETDLMGTRVLPYQVQREGFTGNGPADKILKAYKPQCASASGANKFSEDDTEDFIFKYYDAEGLVPEINKRDDNVYEVLSTYEKDGKVVYEDEVTAKQDNTWRPMPGANDMEVTAQYSKELSAHAPLDPTSSFQQNVGKQRDSTQQLDRMFGPGLQWQQYG